MALTPQGPEKERKKTCNSGGQEHERKNPGATTLLGRGAARILEIRHNVSPNQNQLTQTHNSHTQHTHPDPSIKRENVAEHTHTHATHNKMQKNSRKAKDTKQAGDQNKRAKE
ncbi:hypothetical protein U1Q18_010895 [Sarracenia purpurea var. burkii]